MKSIIEMGHTTQHHHYHNAIIGMDDPASRYGAKWLDKKRSVDFRGGVKQGDFVRGQGGI